MIVQVKRENGILEWALVELHGDLIKTGSSASNNYIGEIFFTKTGNPILIIGIHILHGKETKMDKPMAVIEKDKNPDSTENDYVIKAIVNKKLIFKNRPQPIIQRVSTKITT